TKLLTHPGGELAPARLDAESARDLLDVDVDVGQRLRLEHEQRQARALERRDDLLVAGNGQRAQHQIGLELLDPLDVDAEIRTDARQSAYHLDGIVRVVVHANE